MIQLIPEEWMDDVTCGVYENARDCLEELRELQPEDHFLLVNFASNYVMFIEATEQLRGEGLLKKGHNGSVRRNPLIMARNTFQDAYMNAAKTLGLGVTLRNRLKIEKEKQKEKDPTNPLGI